MNSKWWEISTVKWGNSLLFVSMYLMFFFRQRDARSHNYDAFHTQSGNSGGGAKIPDNSTGNECRTAGVSWSSGALRCLVGEQVSSTHFLYWSSWGFHLLQGLHLLHSFHQCSSSSFPSCCCSSSSHQTPIVTLLGRRFSRPFEVKLISYAWNLFWIRVWTAWVR